LVWAAKYGHTPVLEFLLDRGVRLTAMDDMMPLHWAAAHGQMSVIDLLARPRRAAGGAQRDSRRTVLGSDALVRGQRRLPVSITRASSGGW
jgi:ankyrin repeat protein